MTRSTRAVWMIFRPSLAAFVASAGEAGAALSAGGGAEPVATFLLFT